MAADLQSVISEVAANVDAATAAAANAAEESSDEESSDEDEEEEEEDFIVRKAPKRHPKGGSGGIRRLQPKGPKRGTAAGGA